MYTENTNLVEYVEQVEAENALLKGFMASLIIEAHRDHYGDAAAAYSDIKDIIQEAERIMGDKAHKYQPVKSGMLLQIPIIKNKTIQEFADAALKQVLDDITADGVTIREWIEKISSGEYQPVKHGRWITHNCGDFVCSVCGWEFSDELPYMAREYNAKIEEIMGYCMHCGAKMDGDAE